MSAIDQVIARARQGDVAFSQRRQFKLARTRAIEKLRRFALADPYFYILELIQAAIAGGADYVDIACNEGDVLVSWTGGYIEEAQLAALFDFLFASKDRVDLANVRSLALGVNALIGFAPDQVVIESGNGQPGGTSRMVITGGAESVDVGRAEGTLNGTYVRATKLNRGKIKRETGRSGDDNGGLEYGTVELRCLAAPVPIVFNGQPLFGWSSQRVPSLFGYSQVYSFDEGDLYGTIGRDPVGGAPSFQLLTQGVWIQTYEYELIKGQRFGGIVCFDALHKTVDHSGFVRDERFEELWIRLRPYAEALMGGAGAQVPRITSGTGIEYEPRELRARLREHPRVVVSPSTEDEQVKHRAKVIARLLDAEVLHVPPAQANAVRVLGGRELLLWRPDLGNDADQRFYARAPADIPPPPYLRPPVQLDPPSLNELVERIVERGAPGVARGAPRAEVEQGWLTVHEALDARGQLTREARRGDDASKIRAMLRGLLGESGTLTATLYSPLDPGPAARGLLVRVLSTERCISQQLFASAYPGRVLDIELPTAQVSAAHSFGATERVGEYFAALAVPVLRGQDQRALAGLGVGKIELGSAAARLALQVLARVTTTRLRAARPGRLSPGLSFSLLRPASGFDPFTLELFKTLSGKAISLRALSLSVDNNYGLVYGTIPEVPADLEGLDLDRILELDAVSERTLIAMIGEAGYVRIDARDVLASCEGVHVRDIALGLHAYPDFPLLVEGATASLPAEPRARQALIEQLLQGLRRRLHGELDARDAGADPAELEEHRRQAVRHLQWYVCRELAIGHREQLAAQGLLQLPLFLDLDGEVWGAGAVLDALQSPEGLLVHYGHVLGSAELGALTQAALSGRSGQTGRPASLAVSAFSYRLLQPLGRLRLAFDFDLDDVEAARNPATSATAFLVSETFESPEGSGLLGIPATPLPDYRVALTARGRGVIAAFDELGHLYGVVGSVELSRDKPNVAAIEAIYASIDEQASALLERLIEQLPTLGDDPRRYAAALRVLLTYAGEKLTLIASHVGLSAEVASPLAERILGLPLFDTGAVTQVSGHRMLELFRRHFEARYAAGESLAPLDWATQLASASAQGMSQAHALVLAWLEAHLQPARVIMPASGHHPQGTNDAQLDPAQLQPWPRDQAVPLEVLAWNLERWLAGLRPDELSYRGERVLTRVWILEIPLASGGLFEGGTNRLEIHAEHPLVRAVQAQPTPQRLAWLLLAVYAHINAVLVPVTNAHEAQFHLNVGEALLSETLTLFQKPDAPAGSRMPA